MSVAADEQAVQGSSRWGRFYTRAYAPPYGGVVLFGTYVLAFAAIRVARLIEAGRPGLSTGLLLGTAAFAMIGTLVFRDERGAAAGQPPVRTVVPARVSVATRVVMALLAAASLGIVRGLIVAGDASALIAVLSFAVVALAAIIVAVTGRVPWLVRASLGSSSDHDTST